MAVSARFFPYHPPRVLHVSYLSGWSLQGRDAAGRGRHVRNDGLEAVGHCEYGEE